MERADIPVGGCRHGAPAPLIVHDPDTGNKVIVVPMVSSAPGNNCQAGSTDPDCTATSTVLVPALTITKTAGTTFVVPGGAVQYTITITDTGQTDYVNAIVTDNLAGLLDDATYNTDATSTTGAISYTSPTLTWTGDLAVGDSTTITYSATANNPDTGDKTIVNPVTSSDAGSTCPPASGNADCRTTTAVLTPALTIVTSADTLSAIPGQAVGFTVTATNTGQLPFAAASFTAALAGVLDDATYTSGVAATTGTATITAGTLAWTGTLAIGAQATITY